MAPRTLEERALRSTCPDGTVIVTPWLPGRRWSEPTQCAQADAHREKVRAHLRATRRLDRQALAA